MALVTSDFLENALKNFRAMFANEFDAAKAFQAWKEITQEVKSDSISETYEWLGTVPKMEELKGGDFIFDEIGGPYSFTITNLEWQTGFEVARKTFSDDKLGQIKPKIADLALEAARFPGEKIWDLFEDNDDAFDGTAFFADTRTIGDSGNIDNIATGTGTSVSQLQTDLSTVRATVRKFKDDKGRPMDHIINTIVCPAELEQLFFQALNAVQTPLNQPVVPAGKGERFTASGYQVLVNPYLTDANNWYAFASGPGERKPFIYQNREGPEFNGLTDPNSDAGVIRRRFAYTAYSRFNVGYGDPRRAIKVTNT